MMTPNWWFPWEQALDAGGNRIATAPQLHAAEVWNRAGYVTAYGMHRKVAPGSPLRAAGRLSSVARHLEVGDCRACRLRDAQGLTARDWLEWASRVDRRTGRVFEVMVAGQWGRKR